MSKERADNKETFLQPAGEPGRVHGRARRSAGLRESRHRPQDAGDRPGLDEGGRAHGPTGRHPQRLLHHPQGLRLPRYVINVTET